MKLKLTQRQRDDDNNLVPLINIVFLLLIFFMLAGTFSNPEQFEVEPPRSLSTAEAEKQQIVLLLSADGRLAIGEQELNRADLQRLLVDRLSAEPELQVQLKADGQLAADILLDMMHHGC